MAGAESRTTVFWEKMMIANIHVVQTTLWSFKPYSPWTVTLSILQMRKLRFCKLPKVKQILVAAMEFRP